MSRYLPSAISGPRYREEITRTYYSTHDRRKKAVTMRVIRYSDGREFRRVQFYNGYTPVSLQAEFRQYAKTIMLG